jgi:hypothetical protein
MDDHRYCSRLAPDEQMPGTADPVDVWLLLEYRPAWRAKAVSDHELAATTADWFGSLPGVLAAEGLKARPQFIRQPELESTSLRLMVGSVAGLFEFTAPGYDELQQVDVAHVVANPNDYAERQIGEPRYLVCTNGQRDLCCARFGLPIYQALRERFGARVWQTTHLGGHRFAPNVLVLPQAALYGRVSEESLDEFVRDTELGTLHGPLLRGRHGYAAPAQAAEAYLLKHFDDSWSLRDVNEVQDGWDVSFVSGTDTARLRIVQREQPEMILKSCADDHEKPVRPYLIHSCSINGSMEDQPAT